MSQVLCEKHTGTHDEADDCLWPHYVRPNGPLPEWARAYSS